MKNQITTETVERKPELRGTIAREFIQCPDQNGVVGSFLATNANRQVSPTFPNLVELYAWARDNGWKQEAGAYIYGA